MRRVEAAGHELLQPVDLAALQEGRADRRRIAEQVQDQPAVAAVIAQEREVGVRAELLARVVALQEIRQHRPEMLRERVVEMHAGDGLHHPSVAQAEAATVDGLHPADVRRTVLGDRDAGVAGDGTRHARRPQQLVADVAVDELVQVAEVLGEFPGFGEGRRDQLDQRLGVVGGQVLVGERRAQGLGVGRRGDPALRGDPEGLLLDALQSALEGGGRPAIHEGAQASVEGAVEWHRGVGLFLLRGGTRTVTALARATGRHRESVP